MGSTSSSPAANMKQFIESEVQQNDVSLSCVWTVEISFRMGLKLAVLVENDWWTLFSHFVPVRLSSFPSLTVNTAPWPRVYSASQNSMASRSRSLNLIKSKVETTFKVLWFPWRVNERSQAFGSREPSWVETMIPNAHTKVESCNPCFNKI